MSMGDGPGVSEQLPTEAWNHLEKDPNTILIDVRTKAEWSFVGIPDLSSLGREVHCIEWSEYPNMSPNPRFAESVFEVLGGATPSTIFFICRSGARSLKAAQAVLSASDDAGGQLSCVNVSEGFEGDLDTEKHRGGLNGWKARGLPWRQS